MKEKSHEQIRLDELNTKRVATTKARVAHAIRLCDNPVGCLNEGRAIDDASIEIAHAVNLLEAAVEEMRWACEHFSWDTGVCDDIDAACAKLGVCLAILEDDEDSDPMFAGATASEGLAILGRVLANLIRWFDDEQDVSEV